MGITIGEFWPLQHWKCYHYQCYRIVIVCPWMALSEWRSNLIQFLTIHGMYQGFAELQSRSASWSAKLGEYHHVLQHLTRPATSTHAHRDGLWEGPYRRHRNWAPTMQSVRLLLPLHSQPVACHAETATGDRILSQSWHQEAHMTMARGFLYDRISTYSAHVDSPDDWYKISLTLMTGLTKSRQLHQSKRPFPRLTCNVFYCNVDSRTNNYMEGMPMTYIHARAGID